MLTFLTTAQRRNLRVIAYESNAVGTLEHSAGKYRVTKVTVRPVISLAEAVDPAVGEQLAQETMASCIITNSIAATGEFVPQLRRASSDAAWRRPPRQYTSEDVDAAGQAPARVTA